MRTTYPENIIGGKVGLCAPDPPVDWRVFGGLRLRPPPGEPYDGVLVPPKAPLGVVLSLIMSLERR